MAVALALPVTAGAQTGRPTLRPTPRAEDPGLPGDRGRPDVATRGQTADFLLVGLRRHGPRTRAVGARHGENVGVRAAPLAHSGGGVRLDGRAGYRGAPGMTIIDLVVRVGAGRGVSVSVGLVTRTPLRGRRLPLRFRGRARELVVGFRVPLSGPPGARRLVGG